MNTPSTKTDTPTPAPMPSMVSPDALALLHELEAIVWECNADGSRFTFVSQGAERLLGFPGQSWLALDFWADRLHPDDRGWAVPLRRAAGRRGEDHELEYRMISQDGEVVWLRDHARCSTAPNGKIRSRGVMVEITREKATDAQLREQRDLNATVLDNIEALVALLDPDGTVRGVNRTCERTLGRTARSLLGRSFVERFTSESEAHGVTSLFARLAAGRARAQCEAPAVRRDGGVRRVMWSFTAVRDGAGALTRIVATGVDVTDREHAEERLRQRENELLHAQKMDALGRLAGGMAHDFNNVITAVLGYAHVLEAELVDHPQALEMAVGVREAAEHAVRLTTQLRTLSRRRDAVLAALVPARELAAMREMLARLIGEDILLELDLALGDDQLLGEPGQLTQLVLNLALNARDAMPLGGTLVVALDRVLLPEDEAAARQLPTDCLRLSVSDDGCGMDEVTCAKAFEPFFTTKGQGGTGLGLSTVYGIVRAWGGDVTLESAVGSGTTFHLVFPRIGGPVRQASQSIPERLGDHRGETILLVEDEPVVRRLMRETLRRHDYEVITASDGNEAIAKAAAHRGEIGLLVTDVVMPGMSGPEAAERILQSRPGLRVLFVSGYSNDAMLTHGVAPEGMDFLEKPFAPEVLACRVRALLDSTSLVR